MAAPPGRPGKVVLDVTVPRDMQTTTQEENMKAANADRSRISDVLVVGGGHNGLVAAILAAQSGRTVTLLEASDHLGGATQSVAVFPGRPAVLSRYSYLVSLFPAALAERLGIELPLASRPVSSYTPVVRNGRASGLLVERRPGAATERSFADLTGGAEHYRSWLSFYGQLAGLAAVLAPMLSGPLLTRAQVGRRVRTELDRAAAELFDRLTTEPIGEVISSRFADDTVRGVAATDALIGTDASLFGADLRANRCFLYHVIGRGTGEWLVPIGGMGAVLTTLVDRAHRAGVRIVRDATVESAGESADGVQVQCADGREWSAGHLLAAVAPSTVMRWLGAPAPRPEGSQVKVNLLLDRLPRLKSGADPEVAFAGTTHLDEGFDRLESAFAAAAAGTLPDPLPAEVYCHSLTDPTILNGHPGHTFTVFGLHAPARLFRSDPGLRERAVAAALESLDRQLDEPLADCLSRDADGRPCVDAAVPTDLERELLMPGGHIFHGDLDWPWRDDDQQAETTAAAFGVDVPGSMRILLAGAGSRRGGGVSGLGGAAAADALLTGATGR